MLTLASWISMGETFFPHRQDCHCINELDITLFSYHTLVSIGLLRECFLTILKNTRHTACLTTERGEVVMKAVWWSPTMYSATHPSVAEWLRHQSAKCKVQGSMPTRVAWSLLSSSGLHDTPTSCVIPTLRLRSEREGGSGQAHSPIWNPLMLHFPSFLFVDPSLYVSSLFSR